MERKTPKIDFVTKRVHYLCKTQDNRNNISVLPACRLSAHREANCNALTGQSLWYE